MINFIVRKYYRHVFRTFVFGIAQAFSTKSFFWIMAYCSWCFLKYEQIEKLSFKNKCILGNLNRSLKSKGVKRELVTPVNQQSRKYLKGFPFILSHLTVNNSWIFPGSLMRAFHLLPVVGGSCESPVFIKTRRLTRSTIVMLAFKNRPRRMIVRFI